MGPTVKYHIQRQGCREYQFIIDQDLDAQKTIIPVVGIFRLRTEVEQHFQDKLFRRHYFYGPKFKEIVCDANLIGNAARAIRYSCRPNAELKEV